MKQVDKIVNEVTTKVRQVEPDSFKTQEEPMHVVRSNTESPGIVLAVNGDAYIAGTSMKVRYIIIEAVNLHRNAQQIQAEHDNLTIEQIREAMVYYVLHKAAIDAEIRAENKYVRESRRRSTYRPTIAELRKERKRAETNSKHDCAIRG
jgi:uncharacterized protein (DUF433 family)